ncbi:MAG TPA: glutaredoxin domain-containing protein [Geobacteraceae bacterium]
MKLLCGAVLIFSFMIVGVASGESYRYTDNKSNAQPAPVRLAQEDSAGKPGIFTSGKKVEVFMTSWCGYCRKMISFLKEKGIPYTAYDIENDSAAMETYRSLGVRGVPVVRVGSHIVRGYDPDAVSNYYYDGN